MKKNEYLVSVVIPVYNAEKFLRECIDSVLNSEFDTNKIEILLINDGSSDNSLKICNEYKNNYNNIKVFDQKNSGVSVSRNKGITSSTGKYILFLDSDDTISSRTINNLYSFFEDNYNDIDILTYPIYYNENNKYRFNTRYYAYDKGTGVYDVNEYIFLNQSNVNIMIKNMYNKNELYNTNMILSEDQDLDTRIIMKKERIGYVKEAEYYYRKYEGSVSVFRNNPYYCFDNIMNYNESLLKKYKKGNKIPKYIQALVIGTIGWRIRTDELFPYYLEGKEYDEAIKRVKNIVKQIDTDVIMGLKSINLYHKIYLFNFSERKIDVKIDKDNKILLYCDNDLVYEEKEVTLSFNRFKARNNKIYLLVDLFSVAFEKYKPELYIVKELKDESIKREKIDLHFSNECNYDAHFKVTNVYAFDISFDFKNIKSYYFEVLVNNKKIKIKYDYKRYTVNSFARRDAYILYRHNKFNIKSKNIINKMFIRLKNFKIDYKKYKKSVIYRILYYIYPVRKNIWLYSDSLTSTDNGYTQFMHDIKIKDNIARYYVCKNDSKFINENFSEKEKKHIVIHNSLKHKMLFLHAKKLLTSFVDLQVYSPFNKFTRFYYDIIDYDLIYLQHGILHSNLVMMYSKEYKDIDRFVVSTNFECNNLTTKYHYKEEDLLKSGMPRMEGKDSNVKTENRILLAPSWRKYLIGSLVDNKRLLKKDEFINSSFYKELYSFLHSKELRSFLTKNKLVLDFKLHPIFKDYSNLFDIKKNDVVTLDFDKTYIDKYKIFITDFSSFQFDFVKLHRPIVYFMPDMVEFRSGLHSYRELDLKYEDAFGPLCLKSKELINELNNIVNNKYKVEKKYAERMNKFFLDIKSPCDDIYNELIKNNK